MARTGNLTRKREAAIAALLASETVQDAAEAANVGLRTLWRWLQDSDFQKAYREARRQVVSQATARLQHACSLAVATLEDVMQDGDAAPSARVAAARAVLEFSHRAIELEDLEERLVTLEEAME